MRKYWLMVITMLGLVMPAQAQVSETYNWSQMYNVFSDNSFSKFGESDKREFTIIIDKNEEYVTLSSPTANFFAAYKITKIETSAENETVYIYTTYSKSVFIFTLNKNGVMNMFYDYEGRIVCKSFIKI